MKKYTLTEEHRAQLKPWAEKWIANGMSTKPMDDEDKTAMKIAIKGMYEAANLTPPPENRIVFVPSPFVGRFAAGFAAAIWWLRKNKKQDACAATYAATCDATDDATCDATDDARNKKVTDKKSWFQFDIKAMVSLSVSLKIGEFGIKGFSKKPSYMQLNEDLEMNLRILHKNMQSNVLSQEMKNALSGILSTIQMHNELTKGYLAVLQGSFQRMSESALMPPSSVRTKIQQNLVIISECLEMSWITSDTMSKTSLYSQGEKV